MLRRFSPLWRYVLAGPLLFGAVAVFKSEFAETRALLPRPRLPLAMPIPPHATMTPCPMEARPVQKPSILGGMAARGKAVLPHETAAGGGSKSQAAPTGTRTVTGRACR